MGFQRGFPAQHVRSKRACLGVRRCRLAHSQLASRWLLSCSSRIQFRPTAFPPSSNHSIPIPRRSTAMLYAISVGAASRCRAPIPSFEGAFVRHELSCRADLQSCAPRFAPTTDRNPTSPQLAPARAAKEVYRRPMTASLGKGPSSVLGQRGRFSRPAKKKGPNVAGNACVAMQSHARSTGASANSGRGGNSTEVFASRLRVTKELKGIVR